MIEQLSASDVADTTADLQTVRSSAVQNSRVAERSFLRLLQRRLQEHLPLCLLACRSNYV
jgi:hypothetical protein